MKILWITNTLFPAICKELGIQPQVVGGWMYSGAESLRETNKDIELAVASLYSGQTLKSIQLDGIAYFLIPKSKSNQFYQPKLESYWKEVKRQFLPDVVHIHGTEYPHGLAYVNACGSDDLVVSIQGLVCVYERYYFGGISKNELSKNVTLRDYFRQDSIFSQHSRMRKRGSFEKKLIQQANHVIGRTSWDKAHTWNINPNATYHFCNETLRNEFYHHDWHQNQCEKHSIFLSQSHYPIKGLQQMIKALPLILKHYPDTKVYVAGYNFVTNIHMWRLNGFGKYVRSLMKALNVTEKFTFTGILSEKEMCQRYLKSNVFVCPSSIENSPNSVGEAQLVGIPCVASYVGGVSDMITHEETGLLYRFEEVEMLAESVCRIFSDNALTGKLSRNGKAVASKRHERKNNTQTLSQIYQSICKK